MQRYFLTEITTSDGLVHQGMYYGTKEKSGTALLWVHGFTGKFYGDLTIFEKITERNDFGFASFNNRGHDMIVCNRKKDLHSPTVYGHSDGGAGREVFEECIYDIDAGISFLIDQGYEKVVVIGHSTGAIKCSFYAGFRTDARVAGVILAGPLSDRLSEQKNNPDSAGTLKRMHILVDQGKGDVLLNDLSFTPMTPKRYISLYKQGTTEDHLDYGDEKPTMKYYRDIKQPLLVVLSEKDEYLDRPAEKVKAVFDRFTTSEKYSSVIINSAPHGYEGYEDEFVHVVMKWIRSL